MVFARLGSSFRDPSSFVFENDGELYRQINRRGAADYDSLISSGLYESLVGKQQLIPHEEMPERAVPYDGEGDCYKIIKPRKLPFVSYPYEWCFSQLRDAALLTLQIQSSALEHGLSLKDASSFNIQFDGSRPVFIDTGSFIQYREGEPWVAYRQFCQHFLGPLAVMCHVDLRQRHMLKNMVDGLPMDYVSKLLPHRTWLKYSLLAHIHLHALSQRRHGNVGDSTTATGSSKRISKQMLSALVSSLESAVSACAIPNIATEWSDYYEQTNYSDESMRNKEELVAAVAEKYFDPDDIVHDIGGNTGRFSRLIAKSFSYVVSHDIDDIAVEKNYLLNGKNGVRNVLPLMLDVNNPSPSLGWNLSERDSFLGRVNGAAILALALIHHIVIANNVPMNQAARFFHHLADKMIIEFVPKEDSQVRRLLATREDIFPEYDIDNFRKTFSIFFEIVDEKRIANTERTLFVMRRR